MSERFFTNDPITGHHAVLTDGEAHHFLHVMRGQVGAQVTLFDGSGQEFPAKVTACRRSEVELSVGPAEQVDRELPFKLTLGVALPKGDRQKWLVEKLTELGVTRLVPLITERGVAQPTKNALQRLQKSVIEASKQCGRNRLLELTPAADWQEFITAGKAATRLIAHPGYHEFADVCSGRADDMQIAIGPEGGFTETEIRSALDAGWKKVSLGPRILRVETAAVALAAAGAQQMSKSSPMNEGKHN